METSGGAQLMTEYATLLTYSRRRRRHPQCT